jgi:sulfite reductase alpha subunit-like flavoprotein
MLTLVLLGLLGGSGWFGAQQLKRARRAEAQLRRIASTDDEVIAVLEASKTPMAERLLLEARSQLGKVLSSSAWRALVEDLKMRDVELYRFSVLSDYVAEGLLVTERQYLNLLKLFTPEGYQDQARKLLKACRSERRRSG